jgi:putative endonuclease
MLPSWGLERQSMGFLDQLKNWMAPRKLPDHLRRGAAGEAAAKRYLIAGGYTFLVANFAGPRGEIDLIFRDDDCLMFVEVKTRTTGGWTRPAEAVDQRKRLALCRTAQLYWRKLKNPRVKYRYDIVEVLMEADEVLEIRHLPNAFTE